MDWASKNSLKEKLEQLHGFDTKWHILFINLKGSSKRLLMGAEPGQCTLDFIHEGWLCWLYRWRFICFFRSHNFSMCSEKWGKETITRTFIGDSVEEAFEIIKNCFEHVYRVDSPFKLELFGVGLQYAKDIPG